MGKLEALRRSVVRYFGQGATSVTPEKSPTTDELGDLVRSIIADTEAKKQAPAPLDAVVVDPDNLPWEVWANMQREARAPGWTFCRFGARWQGNARQVFGIVREDIGLWSKAFLLHHTNQQQRRVLWSMTHIPTGLGLGLFMEREYAIQGAELLHRALPDELAELDPDVPSTFGVFMPRLRQTYAAAGLFQYDGYASDADSPEGRFVLWDRSTITAPAGSMLS